MFLWNFNNKFFIKFAVSLSCWNMNGFFVAFFQTFERILKTRNYLADPFEIRKWFFAKRRLQSLTFAVFKSVVEANDFLAHGRLLCRRDCSTYVQVSVPRHPTECKSESRLRQPQIRHPARR